MEQEGRMAAGFGDGWPQRAARWRGTMVPALFFLAAIYYEELFLKLYCFGGLSPAGAALTFLFTVPVALVLGLVCAAVPRRWGPWVLVLCMAVISTWMGAQAIYQRLFKTFLTVFSLTKIRMVAGAFGELAVGELLLNWFPVLMMALPVLVALVYRRRLLPPRPPVRRWPVYWLALAATAQLLAMGVVGLCDGGQLSLRQIYYQTATPELEAKYFGMATQTQLEIGRVVFGIRPAQPPQEEQIPPTEEPMPPEEEPMPQPPEQARHVMEIDFDALIRQAQLAEDEELVQMHRWFAAQTPTATNEWTGRFRGKNLVWIVAEGFSHHVIDPQRTPTLWKLQQEGFRFENFYTPLWGVSTSDGEYVTTTGLIPKSGVWSYSLSAENYMPFAFGNRFRKLGYSTLAYHDYLYTYYDRDRSYPNMGYDFRGVGNGLVLEEVWPPSDLEMMQQIVPQFVDRDPFLVYCLTVSGHLNYTLAENAMAQRHWGEVSDLPYSEGVLAYLACQMELELALAELMEGLEQAGELEDTVIALSADHYPYGLTDEEYGELAGRPLDPDFELYENALLLWSADLEHPVVVDKYCSSLDVMPTLANLFGLEYDARLLAGRDILSDEPGLVIFSDYSFLTEVGAYRSELDLFTPWPGRSVQPGYVEEMIAQVQNKVAYSAAILDRDYYRLVLNGPPRPAPPET